MISCGPRPRKLLSRCGGFVWILDRSHFRRLTDLGRPETQCGVRKLAFDDCNGDRSGQYGSLRVNTELKRRSVRKSPGHPEPRRRGIGSCSQASYDRVEAGLHADSWCVGISVSAWSFASSVFHTGFGRDRLPIPTHRRRGHIVASRSGCLASADSETGSRLDEDGLR